jgi:hypothetical protein
MVKVSDRAPMVDGKAVVTFPQFRQRMAGVSPLRGLSRVAVVGGGDASRCVVEGLLGIGPAPLMAASALDFVGLVDWYGDTLRPTCEEWIKVERGRYQQIGRYLRPDRRGVQRLTVRRRRGYPVPLPGRAVLEGRSYDLAVLATGSRVAEAPGLPQASQVFVVGDDVVARRRDRLFEVGPRANLAFTDQENRDGVSTVRDVGGVVAATGAGGGLPVHGGVCGDGEAQVLFVLG